MEEHQRKIIDGYVDWVLEEGHEPASIHKLCKHLGLGEREFFKHFASFAAVEKAVWTSLAERSQQLVEADEGFARQSAREKMLAFFYTFFDQALDRRSFVLLRWPDYTPGCVPRPLTGVREVLDAFAEKVLADGKDEGEVSKRGRLNDVYPGLFVQLFLYCADFNKTDTSDNFQRTDELIEKSINLAFDAIGRSLFESTFDLLRFVAARRS